MRAACLAFAMGKLTVIEWSLQCVQTVMGDGMSKIDAKALEIVQKWLGDRTEQLRRDAYAAAHEAEHGTPASWVAMAAFWSEGSMGPPPPAPPLAPGPTQCAHAATGAILLAAVIRQPEKPPIATGSSCGWGSIWRIAGKNRCHSCEYPQQAGNTSR